MLTRVEIATAAVLLGCGSAYAQAPECVPPPAAWDNLAAWHSQCAGAHRNSYRCDRTRDPRRQSDHIRRLALDRRNMRRCFTGARVRHHVKSDDDRICRDGASTAAGTPTTGAYAATGNSNTTLSARRRHDSHRAGAVCGVRDGICAARFVDGSRLVRRPGWHSARLDRDRRGRPQPSIRCAEPQSVCARRELADASQRHDPALDSIDLGGAEHAQMPVHPDRRAYDQGDADHVRVAFDGHTTGQAGSRLPVTNLG
jgi:hypothetical protein